MVSMRNVTAHGANGLLAGTLTVPNGKISESDPVVLIIPGSGPTDRDGNSPYGVRAAPYKLLAESLTGRGYPVIRFDKRGMFGSAHAEVDPNNVTIADYVDDLLAWSEAAQMLLPTKSWGRRIVPLGHSEGGIVALAAVGRLPAACGLILVGTPGRPMSQIILAQLEANPANAPLLEQAEMALRLLEGGHVFDDALLQPALGSLFASKVQAYLIDVFRHHPARLARDVAIPSLIIHGLRDLQVSEADARMLASSLPDAELALVRDMNHVLKKVVTDDVRPNIATYGDPSLPIDETVTDAIARFLNRL